MQEKRSGNMKILIASLLFLSAHASSAVCADFKDQAEAQRYHESQKRIQNQILSKI